MRAVDVVGDVRDRQALIVDDMITTAGTVEAAVQAVLDLDVPISVVGIHDLLANAIAAMYRATSPEG